MKLNNSVLILAISTLLLTACADTEDKDPSLLDGSQAGTGIGDASTNGLNNGTGINGSEMGGSGMYGSGDGASSLGPEFSDPNNPLSKRTIYFMLDSFQIQQDFVPVIAAHSQYLLANPSQHITLEGHGDERGSREYNIALGEQRAKSVASIMKIQGVSDSQIGIVSYGEEKPAAFGNDESAWELNRRVEINYQGR
ncbi:MAG: peptidoglycan-associated lipoprotein Pal [Methylovulum sp.]|uniref:peptidoglycan-associated lipoprotein Pal n=1 Tax=Methylovulum sp. TaxID=1916980 RepID=UPI002638588A|nr:peptidoglycan-associated lipoprotein Pal [Methylovulum sp.]MDD2725519.1 peptidoglycan-associated lipoprotein Pal [Methylovulum sp.]MDD5126097.1 peptidoglycan-associated lipoprotein Pal [Methylovulum sp.]